MKKKEYNAESIKHYDGLEGPRKRPTMYIGKIGTTGIFHLFREGVDNSIDEYSEGYCNEILIDIDEKKNTILIKDNGRGIPIEKIEILCTKLHSGGKFDSDSYKYSSGLNGVGLKCINALSDMFKVTVERDGVKVQTEYSKGKCKQPVTEIGKSKKTGTTIYFHPDKTVLKEIDIDITNYLEYCELLSYLNPGLKIRFHAIKRTGEELNKIFNSKEGLFDLLNKMSKDLITTPQLFTLSKSDIIDKSKDENPKEDYSITVAFAYSNSDEENVMTFCNNVKTTEGGTHYTGLKMGLSTLLPSYIRNNNLITKKDENLELTGDDTREGLVAVVVAKHTDPLFDSQAKDKLTNNDLQGLSRRLVTDKVKEYLDSNKKDAKIIANKVILAAKSRTAAKKVKEVSKKANSALNLKAISKFVDCANNYPDYKELFIVEGDSAGSSLSNARDVHTQAIYKLRGKPLNTYEKNINTILNNNEINDLTSILGCGLGKNCNVENFKWNKIIISSDSDIDGFDIKALLSGFFFKYMPELVKQGFVYYACSPLYRIREGKKEIYLEGKKDYNEYVIKNIMKKFILAYNKEGKLVKFSEREFKSLLLKFNNYKLLLDEISLKLCCPNHITETLALTYKNEKLMTKKLPTLKIKNNIIEGLSESEDYICILLDDNIKNELDRIVRFFKEEVKVASVYHKGVNDTKPVNMTLIETLERMYNECTPKHRQRFKGLGELNDDQLWDTTLDPNKRTLIQLTLEDMEEAMKEFDIQLGKDADKRKVSIRDNEDKIEIDDLDR